MADEEREAIVNSMFEGIFAAFNSTLREGNPTFTNCQTMAEAALASLEADGFKVVRNA
jgi:hypothetical protein